MGVANVGALTGGVFNLQVIQEGTPIFFRQRLSIQTACPSLGNGYTLTGDSTSARFYGGVTSDGGGSFGNRFSPSETIQYHWPLDPLPTRLSVRRTLRSIRYLFDIPSIFYGEPTSRNSE